MDHSDEYQPAVVQNARLVLGGKPQLVWITPKKVSFRDRELNMCLSIIGMRLLTSDEISRDKQRLCMYQSKPAKEGGCKRY